MKGDLAMLVSTIFFVIVFTSIDSASGGISFEGSKSGGLVRLNCSFGQQPTASTVEFLVDGSTAYNIRLYKGECYRTTSGIPCTSNECQCSLDGRQYFWVYQYTYNRLRVECKAKLTEDCFISATILFTESESRPSVINPDECQFVSHSNREISSIPVIGFAIVSVCLSRYISSLKCIFVVCLLFICCSQTGLCEKAVFFTYKDVNGTLCMYCDVKNLHFGVELIDPRGLSYHCTAAIALLAPGDCDQSLPGSPPFKMQQDIQRNRTILTLYNNRLECENGIWQCKHGTNTGEESNVTVSVSRPRATTSTIEHSDTGGVGVISIILGIFCGLFLIVIFVGGVYVYLNKRRNGQETEADLPFIGNHTT